MIWMYGTKIASSLSEILTSDVFYHFQNFLKSTIS